MKIIDIKSKNAALQELREVLGEDPSNRQLEEAFDAVVNNIREQKLEVPVNYDGNMLTYNIGLNPEFVDDMRVVSKFTRDRETEERVISILTEEFREKITPLINKLLQ